MDEVQRMIIEKRYQALNIHLVHVEGDHPAEDGDQSVELGGLCGQVVMCMNVSIMIKSVNGILLLHIYFFKFY